MEPEEGSEMCQNMEVYETLQLKWSCLTDGWDGEGKKDGFTNLKH